MNFLSTLSPTASQMIRLDHAHVLAQFHKVQPDASRNVCDAACKNICDALEVHAQLEEEIVYPALREAGLNGPVLDKSVPEHDEMRRGIDRLRGLQGQPQEQLEALCELMNGVMHHVADEETKLLPMAERRLGKERLSELGARMTKRRMELVAPKVGELALNMARATPAKTAMMMIGALAAGLLLKRGMRRRYRY